MLPNLRIVPTKSLLVHETTDSTRMERLKKLFQNDDCLRDPPIAAPLSKNKYVILDGVNRFTISKKLKFPHLLVQVINYNNPSVKLLTWNHVIVGVPFESWLREWGRIDIKYLLSVPKNRAQVMLQKHLINALIILPTGKCYILKKSKEEREGITILDKFVKTYKDKYPFYRTVERDMKSVQKFYPDATALIVFPLLTKQDILRFISKKLKIPSGISRHVVPGRALHVNLPFSVLRSRSTTTEKNHQLKKFIKKLKLLNRIRYYSEPVYLYDEY